MQGKADNEWKPEDPVTLVRNSTKSGGNIKEYELQVALSGKPQTKEGPAIISQPEEPQVALSEEPQTMEGPAIISQPEEPQVALSGEPQTIEGAAIIRAPDQRGPSHYKST
ncbi:uncharacterized protein LOC134246664 [Saccostrea cucullata]|uniref:uncharacterized protein LOC134246664 n=1 Tax=Saccostrea cuccullata TaxID=36930 RepID=UPI002ED09AE7